MIYTLPIITALLARASGGGLGVSKMPRWFNRVPELLFAAVIGYVAFGLTWYAAIAMAWSFIAMELGHGNAYHMGVLQKDFPDRWQSLDYIVRPIARLFKFEPRSRGYCWIFMGLKGFLIATPLGLPALSIIILWPLAYQISFSLTKDSSLGEWLSGLFIGAILMGAL
jgi:hypothetical protein